MTRYHVEFYSDNTGEMICWYSTGNKDEALKINKQRYAGVTIKLKEVRDAQH